MIDFHIGLDCRSPNFNWDFCATFDDVHKRIKFTFYNRFKGAYFIMTACGFKLGDDIIYVFADFFEFRNIRQDLNGDACCIH